MVHRWANDTRTPSEDEKLLKDKSLPRHVCFGQEESVGEELDSHAEVFPSGLRFLPKDMAATVGHKVIQGTIQRSQG